MNRIPVEQIRSKSTVNGYRFYSKEMRFLLQIQAVILIAPTKGSFIGGMASSEADFDGLWQNPPAS